MESKVIKIKKILGKSQPKFWQIAKKIEAQAKIWFSNKKTNKCIRI